MDKRKKKKKKKKKETKNKQNKTKQTNVTANTSILQHTVHTTNQLTSLSCYIGAIQKSLSLNEKGDFRTEDTVEWTNKAEVRPEEQKE